MLTISVTRQNISHVSLSGCSVFSQFNILSSSVITQKAFHSQMTINNAFRLQAQAPQHKILSCVPHPPFTLPPSPSLINIFTVLRTKISPTYIQCSVASFNQSLCRYVLLSPSVTGDWTQVRPNKYFAIRIIEQQFNTKKGACFYII